MAATGTADTRIEGPASDHAGRRFKFMKIKELAKLVKRVAEGDDDIPDKNTLLLISMIFQCILNFKKGGGQC